MGDHASPHKLEEAIEQPPEEIRQQQSPDVFAQNEGNGQLLSRIQEKRSADHHENGHRPPGQTVVNHRQVPAVSVHREMEKYHAEDGDDAKQIEIQASF